MHENTNDLVLLPLQEVRIAKFITSDLRITVKNILIRKQNIIQPVHSVQYSKI